MTKKQELLKKIFESELERHLNELGYGGFILDFEDNIYNLSFPNLPFSIFFDDFEFFSQPTFLNFYLNKSKILSLWDISEQESFINQSTKHIKDDFNKKRLEENQQKIKHILETNKKISITKIAEELGITRQAIYKNADLKKFIDDIKKQ